MNLYAAARRHIGVVASFVFSLANFAILLLLLDRAAQADFGLFALAQVFIQFGIGLVNASVSAPMVVMVARAGSPVAQSNIAASFAKAGLGFSLAGSIVVAILIAIAGADLAFALVVALLATLNWFRWCLRSMDLALEDYLRPAVADLLYGTVVLLALAVVVVGPGLDLMTAAELQALGCAAAMVSVGTRTRQILRAMPAASWRPFVAGIRQHGRWTLLGVATTEATANAHAYLVGFLAGPAAFAPVAAVTLFYRPVAIVIQGLTQYERPQMARSIHMDEGQKLGPQVRTFSLVSVATWGANTAAVCLLVWTFPGVIGNDPYVNPAMELAALLLAGVFLLRAIRGGASCGLQAAGAFQPLALASLIAAPFTIGGAIAAILVFNLDAIWSLLGVLAGEVVLCALIYKTFHELPVVP